MGELILKMAIAHLLGDFVFQSNRMAAEIERRKFASRMFYLHIGIHLLLVLVVTGFALRYMFPALLLALSHFLVDSMTKVWLAPKIGKMANFALDQTLHGVAIALFVHHFHPYAIDFETIFNYDSYLLVAAILATTFVSAIVVKRMMEGFRYPLPNDGLAEAGKYIGMLERFFIFVFVVNSFWEGVGFLLAAKSIFRFGDLKEKKDIKLTEYILIGTLLSFGLALLIAVGYLKLM